MDKNELRGISIDIGEESDAAASSSGSKFVSSTPLISAARVAADITAKAIDYTLKRWGALSVHVNDARVPVDNNAVENMMRPIALGRKNWLFIGSQQAGERAAILMSLIESAKLNGHDAWAYLKDVLTKLPTWPNSRLEELLPHRWVAPSST